MFRFESPWLLVVLALVPLALFCAWRRQGRAVAYSSSSLLTILPTTIKLRCANLPLYIRALAVCLLIVALARPQWGDEKHEVSTDGIDIVLSIDVSGSMAALDMDDSLEKTRLDVVKEVVRDFVDKRVNDRMGLVVFAGEAYTQSPMVFDGDMLQTFVSRIEIGMTPTDGTAIGLGLMNSLARLEKSKARSKIVVLLTDGENTVTDVLPKTAAEAAAKLGIKVYTIAVGKKGNVPYKGSFFGRERIEYFKSNPDFTAMEEMAEITKGTFYRAGDTGTLTAIYKDIDSLEKTKIESALYFKWRELFTSFIAAALVLLCFDILLRSTWLRRMV